MISILQEYWNFRIFAVSFDSVPNILKNEKPSKDQDIQQEIVL